MSSLLSRTGGLLLAGGRSERFGGEKAVALFRGRPLMDVVSNCFAGCAALAVSASAGSAAEAHAQRQTLQVLHDDARYPSGPLVGVCSGLNWANEKGLDFLATAPCDAPFLPRDVFVRLVSSIGAGAGAYAVTAQGEHPLCATWRTSLATPLSQTLQSGVHPPVRDFLAEYGVVRVLFDGERQFANANTLEELRLLERE
jgi:molybdopterin-guanine dinucleotide biosynthesis protein A